MKLSFWLYNLSIHLFLPVVTVINYLGFKDRSPERHSALKFDVPAESFLTGDITLWLHCASVGEAGLANQILQWKKELNLPGEEILVSTQTQSGLEQIDHDQKILLPVDYPGLIGPLVNRVDAQTLIVFETELWPNLFRMHPNDLYVFNGRLSDASINWYRRMTPLIRDTLNYCDRILARSETDRRRFGEFVESDSVPLENVGNLKWVSCLEPPEKSLELPFVDDKPIVTIGSTHEGEEEMILSVLEGEDLNVILGPRHLSRLNEVETLLGSMDYRGIKYSDLRENGNPRDRDFDLLVLDEFGLLEAGYRHADLAIIGGSWDETGGHNLMEAAQYGVPILSGPNLTNFRDSAEFLRELDLLSIAETKTKLREAVRSTLRKRDSANDRFLERLHESIHPIEQRYKEVLTRE